tara:strand:+ start:13587 stop:14117 length:531 start_codon:yes stop_codon:yes gene_type:complete
LSDIHILTGPPGSGKSTIVDLLANTCSTIPEPARRVLAQQRRIGGQGTGEQNPALFVDLMLEQSLHDLAQVPALSGPVISDRGLPDLLAYAAYWNLGTSRIERALEAADRAVRVFWFPAWQAIYAPDAERTLDFDGARAFGNLTRRAYESLGYELIEVPCVDAEARAAFIRNAINA